jgi:hypothetical protein
VQIDFTKLLGFETLSDQIAGGLDFQDESLSDKLGAKIGPEPGGPTLFQDDTMAARLGAKVGVEVHSDVRLKRDIEHLATRSDGLPIYAFKYLWDDEVHVGVMAQDLLRNEAWAQAVVRKEGGALFVNYARLGLRMTTLDEWQAKGMDALTR